MDMDRVDIQSIGVAAADGRIIGDVSKTVIKAVTSLASYLQNST